MPKAKAPTLRPMFMEGTALVFVNTDNYNTNNIGYVSFDHQPITALLGRALAPANLDELLKEDEGHRDFSGMCQIEIRVTPLTLAALQINGEDFADVLVPKRVCPWCENRMPAADFISLEQDDKLDEPICGECYEKHMIEVAQGHVVPEETEDELLERVKEHEMRTIPGPMGRPDLDPTERG